MESLLFPGKNCSKLYPCCTGNKRTLPNLRLLTDNYHLCLKQQTREGLAPSGQVNEEWQRILSHFAVGGTNVLGVPFLCQAQPKANLTCFFYAYNTDNADLFAEYLQIGIFTYGSKLYLNKNRENLQFLALNLIYSTLLFWAIHMRLIKPNTLTPWTKAQASKQYNHFFSFPFPPLISEDERPITDEISGSVGFSDEELVLFLWSNEPVFIIDAWLVSRLHHLFVWEDIRKQSQVSIYVSFHNPPPFPSLQQQRINLTATLVLWLSAFDDLLLSGTDGIKSTIDQFQLRLSIERWSLPRWINW